MNKVLANLNKTERAKVQKKKMPDFIKPMLAELNHDHFFDKKNWWYERKFDGERCLVFKKNNQVILKSRNNKKINVSYPEIEKACKKLEPKEIIMDGEVVAFKNNVTDFSKLQNRMHLKSKEEARQTGIKVFYYVFDIIYLDGYDLTKLPLEARDKILRQATKFKDPLRYSIHRKHNTKKYLQDACEKGWEGLMVKRIDSPYIHKRSDTWLKFKCVHEQELVIGGYTEPQGERIAFGALLLGYYENNKLKYAGKVGTGFTDDMLQYLQKRFKENESKKSPFAEKISEKDVHWLKPKFVCEVGFTEWTNDNKLRHPRFLGLRRDKSAKKVHQEK